VLTQRKGGGLIERWDQQGGVFALVPGKQLRVAYSYGPEGDQKPMWTCPQSAIPIEVFQLLIVWQACKTMGTLPVAGGLLDQPVWVQRYFPVFETELRRADRVKLPQPPQTAPQRGIGQTQG
jgi:hypothetical protein